MSKTSQHNSLTSDRWQQLPAFQQILMIANELNRAGNWLNKRQYREAKSCYERALELTSLTLEDNRWQNKRRELARFKEITATLYADPAPDSALNAQLMKCLIALEPKAWHMMYGQE